MTRRLLAALVLVLAVAAWLRFTAIGDKPFWLDETYTALLCMGRGPGAVPFGVQLSGPDVAALFRLNRAASAATIVRLLRDADVSHTHPPLFYVLTHWWLAWLDPTLASLAWALRAPAAAFGVLTVAAAFAAGWAVASPRAGLLAAALAAVSPLGVFLAHEGRNYTLPTLVITLALAALALILRRAAAGGGVGVWPWGGWIAANVAACYSHYFAAVLFVAQAAALAWALRRTPHARSALAATAAVGLAFLPWAPTLAPHATMPGNARPIEAAAEWVGVGYDLIKGLQLMVAGRRPTHLDFWLGQTLRIAYLLFSLWVGALLVGGVARLWRGPSGIVIRALVAVGVVTTLAFVAASVLLRRQYFFEPRYVFAFYPPLLLLLATALATLPARAAGGWRRALLAPPLTVAAAVILAVGLANSVLVSHGVAMVKGGNSLGVAAELARVSEPPVLLAFGVGPDPHERLLLLTYAVEMQRRVPAPPPTSVVFVPRSSVPLYGGRSDDPQMFWRGLAAHARVTSPPRALWVTLFGIWDVSGFPPTFAWPGPAGGAGACAMHPSEAGRGRDGAWRPPLVRYECGARA